MEDTISNTSPNERKQRSSSCGYFFYQKLNRTASADATTTYPNPNRRLSLPKINLATKFRKLRRHLSVDDNKKTVSNGSYDLLEAQKEHDLNGAFRNGNFIKKVYNSKKVNECDGKDDEEISCSGRKKENDCKHQACFNGNNCSMSKKEWDLEEDCYNKSNVAENGRINENDIKKGGNNFSKLKKEWESKQDCYNNKAVVRFLEINPEKCAERTKKSCVKDLINDSEGKIVSESADFNRNLKNGKYKKVWRKLVLVITLRSRKEVTTATKNDCVMKSVQNIDINNSKPENKGNTLMKNLRGLENVTNKVFINTEKFNNLEKNNGKRCEDSNDGATAKAGNDLKGEGKSVNKINNKQTELLSLKCFKSLLNLKANNNNNKSVEKINARNSFKMRERIDFSNIRFSFLDINDAENPDWGIYKVPSPLSESRKCKSETNLHFQSAYCSELKVSDYENHSKSMDFNKIKNRNSFNGNYENVGLNINAFNIDSNNCNEKFVEIQSNDLIKASDFNNSDKKAETNKMFGGDSNCNVKKACVFKSETILLKQHENSVVTNKIKQFNGSTLSNIYKDSVCTKKTEQFTDSIPSNEYKVSVLTNQYENLILLNERENSISTNKTKLFKDSTPSNLYKDLVLSNKIKLFKNSSLSIKYNDLDLGEDNSILLNQNNNSTLLNRHENSVLSNSNQFKHSILSNQQRILIPSNDSENAILLNENKNLVLFENSVSLNENKNSALLNQNENSVLSYENKNCIFLNQSENSILFNNYENSVLLDQHENSALSNSNQSKNTISSNHCENSALIKANKHPSCNNNTNSDHQCFSDSNSLNHSDTKLVDFVEKTDLLREFNAPKRDSIEIYKDSIKKIKTRRRRSKSFSENSYEKLLVDGNEFVDDLTRSGELKVDDLIMRDKLKAVASNEKPGELMEEEIYEYIGLEKNFNSIDFEEDSEENYVNVDLERKSNELHSRELLNEEFYVIGLQNNSDKINSIELINKEAAEQRKNENCVDSRNEFSKSNSNEEIYESIRFGKNPNRIDSIEELMGEEINPEQKFHSNELISKERREFYENPGSKNNEMKKLCSKEFIKEEIYVNESNKFCSRELTNEREYYENTDLQNESNNFLAGELTNGSEFYGNSHLQNESNKSYSREPTNDREYCENVDVNSNELTSDSYKNVGLKTEPNKFQARELITERRKAFFENFISESEPNKFHSIDLISEEDFYENVVFKDDPNKINLRELTTKRTKDFFKYKSKAFHSNSLGESNENVDLENDLHSRELINEEVKENVQFRNNPNEIIISEQENEGIYENIVFVNKLFDNKKYENIFRSLSCEDFASNFCAPDDFNNKKCGFIKKCELLRGGHENWELRKKSDENCTLRNYGDENFAFSRNTFCGCGLSSDDTDHGQNGFDDLRRYVKQGGDFCKELSTILQERYEAEIQYSKSLSKLSVKLSRACREGVGGLNEAWKAVAAELEARAEAHRQMGVILLEETARPLRTLNENQHRSRKHSESVVDKAGRVLADWRAAEAKSKKHSHACARDNEKLQDAMLESRLSRTTSLIQLPNIHKTNTDKDSAKLEGKKRKAEDAVKKADIEYYSHCVRSERARLEWESAVLKGAVAFQSLEEERLNNLKSILTCYLKHSTSLTPKLAEATEKIRTPVEEGEPQKDLTTFISLRQSSQQTAEQLLPDFYCEHITLAMNRERRKQALVKLLQLIKQDIERERKSKDGLENLSKAIKQTPTFGSEDSQQTVTEKLYHMKSMLTYLEGARYKVQSALAELDCRPRNGHPLASHITITRDKAGLQQSVLKVPQWLREQWIETEKIPEKKEDADSDGDTNWIDRGMADGNSNQPDSDFDEFSSQGSSICEGICPTEENPVQPIAHCKVLYTYTPNLPDELSIKPGDVVSVYRQQEDGWWLGECNGAVGIFPATYVETIPT